MDQYLVNYFISLTVAFPAVVGLWKWRFIDNRDKPVIIAWCSVMLSETVRYLLIRNGIYSNTSYNLFVLLLMWLYLWQFKCWGLLKNNIFWLILISMTSLWVADHFLLNGYRLDVRNYWFRIGFSFMQVILAVTSINSQLISEKKRLIGNHRFLICIGFIIFYTYRIFVDAFNLQGMSPQFLKNLGDLNRYLLQLYYFIFLMAALCIPRKKNFILPYSSP